VTGGSRKVLDLLRRSPREPSIDFSPIGDIRSLVGASPTHEATSARAFRRRGTALKLREGSVGEHLIRSAAD